MSKTVGMGAKAPEKDDIAKLQATIDEMNVAGEKLLEENKGLKAENAKLLKELKKE